MSSAEAVLRWWLAFSLVAVAFAPVTWWMAAGLGRYRQGLIRPVGLVIATFIIWWPSALAGLPFQRETVILATVIGGAAGWALLLRRSRLPLDELRSLITFELIWLASLLGYVAFRSANPDIANTEKPMEIALLSSVALSSEVPAPDPWYAGSPINYYYFGYQSIASLIHLSGVQAAVAFNLMLGSLFASAIVVTSALGASLAARARLSQGFVWLAGGLAVFFLVFAGNLETLIRLIKSPGETISAGWWNGVGWQASRVIVDAGVNGNPSEVETINEFPAFSFVLGDLHPHVTTLPVLLATIALAVGLTARDTIQDRFRVTAVGAFAGLLYASNSWDAPVGVVVVFGGIILASGRVDREVAGRIGLAAIGAAIAALPFALDYTAPVGVSTNDVPGWFARIPVIGTLPDTIAVVTWRPSSASELLIVHGVWIVGGAIFSIWALRDSRYVRRIARDGAHFIVPAGLIILAMSIAWAPALLFLGLPAVLCLSLAIWDDRSAVRLIGAIFAAGFGLALVPEFFYIQDSFGSRMNTVFKLNFQAWLFLGIATGAGLILAVNQSSGRVRLTAASALVGAVVVAAPYAPLSAEDWMDMGVASGTLDGSAYLGLTNPAEASAIDWLAAHGGPDDVLVEFPGCAYQTLHGVPMNRFSAFTGVPTLLGWANHERQWRRGEFSDLSAVMAARDALAQSWLDGQPAPSSSDLQPRFVIFGAIERSTSERCPDLIARGQAEIDALVAQGWTIGFADGPTTILVRSEDPAAAVVIEGT